MWMPSLPMLISRLGRFHKGVARPVREIRWWVYEEAESRAKEWATKVEKGWRETGHWAENRGWFRYARGICHHRIRNTILCLPNLTVLYTMHACARPWPGCVQLRRTRNPTNAPNKSKYNEHIEIPIFSAAVDPFAASLSCTWSGIWITVESLWNDFWESDRYTW